MNSDTRIINLMTACAMRSAMITRGVASNVTEPRGGSHQTPKTALFSL